MQPLAQEAALALIVRAAAQPLLPNPPFPYGFPKHPLLLLGETELLGLFSSAFYVKIYIYIFNSIREIRYWIFLNLCYF